MRVLIAGGGTGGHIYPGIAIAQHLQEQGVVSDFACTQRNIDKKILSVHRDLFSEVVYQPVVPVGVSPIAFIKFLRRFIESERVIKDYINRHSDVQAVVGLGGFGSVAGVRVGHKYGIKTAILNPDFVPGRANRLCGKYTDKIFVHWSESSRFFKKQVEAVGVPMRKSIADAANDEVRNEYRRVAREEFGLAEDKKTLVVVGGSSGARSLNMAVAAVLSEIFGDVADSWQIIHLTGENDFTRVKGIYAERNIDVKVMKFFDRMELIWSIADLAICRAGAIAIAEVSVCRVPAIFLPYPYHRDNHQKRNAAVLAERGAGIIVEDDGCAGERTVAELKTELSLMLTDNLKLVKMRGSFGDVRTDAAERIVEWIVGE